MLSLFGSGIGRGIAIGSAYVLKNSDIETPHYKIGKDDIRSEVARFRVAVANTEKQYKKILKPVSYTHLTLPTIYSV